VSDIRGTSNGSVEEILYSQNNQFRAAFDVNGDGLGDNRDLFALGDELVSAGAGQAVLNSYTDLLLDRGDVNAAGGTNGDDVAALYANFGAGSWLYDMNVDGTVDIDDVATMITEVFRTVPGDFNVDGAVDSADYVTWRDSQDMGSALYTHGDADLDGDVDGNDLAAWSAGFGFVRQPLAPGAGSGTVLAAVPEPATVAIIALASTLLGMTTKTRRTQRRMIAAPVPNHAAVVLRVSCLRG
jgi:hypothetical protein